MCADFLFAKFSNSRKIHHSLKYGLTLFELLIVLGCILFILAFFLPALRIHRDSPTRVICSNNVRQLFTGYNLYCDENNNNLPLQPDIYSLNEISKETLDFLMLYTGINVDRLKANNREDIPPQKIFYCPTNILQKRHMTNFWNASNDYRTVGYFFLIDSKNGREKIKGSGNKIWLKKLNVDKPANKELITDMLICDEVNYKSTKYPNGNFTKCPSKILGEKGFEDSSHLKSEQEPYGGNIGFADGHVEWLSFREMERRYGQNPVCWW